MQHFIKLYSRHSRYRTKSHDKSTISHDISRYSRYQTVFSKLEEIIRRHPQGCFMYGIHQSMDAISFFAKECVSFDYPASYRGWQKHSFRHVGLKTVHRTVFLTPSQFSRNNSSLTAIISICKKLCFGRAFCFGKTDSRGRLSLQNAAVQFVKN